MPEITTTNYVGKCRTKGCKSALHFADTTASARAAGSGFTFANHAGEAGATGIAYLVGNHGTYARCGEHGLFKLSTVRGTYNAAKTCNARCTNATGASCDCSCGGANHGAGHGGA